MVTTIRSHGAEPVLATYPTRFGVTLSQENRDQLDSERLYSRSPRALPAVMLAFQNAAADVVRDLARRRQVLFCDLHKVMNGRREWFVDPVHYTDVGAGVVADQVGQAVLDAVATRSSRAGHER